MDVHLWRLLRHHRVHTLLPQLQVMVLPRPRHDHLHRLVPHHRRRRPRPGNIASSTTRVVKVNGNRNMLRGGSDELSLESGLLVDDLLLVPTSAPNSIAAVWKRGRNHDNDALLWVADAGGRRGALGSDEAGAVLHRSHQHTLHLRRPRGHRVSAPHLSLRCTCQGDA